MLSTPNILWIMTDQQRADALGCVSPWMHTPNLDRLASEGTRLTNLFAQSPVCVPSRCNFVTGRYPHAHRVRENHAQLGPGEPHLFRVLKAAGYRTGIVGKNHMFAPRDLAPLDVDASKAGGKPQEGPWADHLKAVTKDMALVGSWAGARFHNLPEEGSSTHRIGTAAVDAIQTLASEDTPFFLWVSFHDPHAPHTVHERFASLYPLDSVPLPDGVMDGSELSGKPSRQAVKRAAQFMDRATEEDIRRYIAVYSGMISYVDEWVGKILSALDDSSLRENTIVVFVSDHGDFRGEHGMVKKDLVLYDSLLNIPGIFRWPGVIEARQENGALTEQVDIYPTLCDLIGVDVPKGVQGRSFAPILRDEVETHKDAVFGEICPPDFENPYPDVDRFRSEWESAQKAEDHPLKWTAPFNVPGDHIKSVRTDKYRYVWYRRGEEELYDLMTDPGERVNLASDPLLTTIRAELRNRLLEWFLLSEDPRDPKDDQILVRDYPWGTPTILLDG